jgi:hypothetical protein
MGQREGDGINPTGIDNNNNNNNNNNKMSWVWRLKKRNANVFKFARKGRDDLLGQFECDFFHNLKTNHPQMRC